MTRAWYIKHMKILRRIVPVVVLLLLVAAGAGFWLKHDEVLDWVAARGYEPPTSVQQMAVDTTMTAYAEQLFYANRPVVEGKASFNKHCTDPSEQVAVLGCFTGNRLGIYIYDVKDERLTGIKQVTAAHEMLHQAYQRLDQKEKNRIGGLLQEYYDLRASRQLKDKLASYKQDDTMLLQNEMHSIFGTEADGLSAELETYYKQYFADRQKVLALHHKYQAEFDKRIDRIKTYDKRLTKLEAQIEASKAELAALETALQQRRAQMDAYLSANRIEEYNQMVPGFNAAVGTYRAKINATNELVDGFNRWLRERNALAVQERELEDAIDSSLDAAARQ